MRRVRDMWPQVASPMLAAALGVVINLLTDRFAWALVATLGVLLGIQILIEVREARKGHEGSTEAPGLSWSLPTLLRKPRLWVVVGGAVTAVAVILVVAWARAGVDDNDSPAAGASLAGLWGDPTPQCPAPDNGNYAIAVGARANSPRPAIPAEMVTSMVSGAKNTEKISILRIDGTPAVITRLALHPQSGSTAHRDAALNRFLQQVRETVAAVRPGSAEAAPLAALSLAAREVSSGGAVVMVDSGLQTVDPIDFRQGFLTASPTEISKWLKGNDLLPDLTGRTVLFAGLGDTAAPQPTLNDALRRNLVATWQQIAKDAGASCVSMVTAPALGPALDRSPQVGVVPLPQTPSLRLSCLPSSFTTASTIGFQSDSASFLDPTAAAVTLRTFADDIRAGNRRITITGTTASFGTQESQLSLSLARARAVEQELLKYGVPADQITVKAAGSDFPGFVDDADAAGIVNPLLAAKNRSVILQLDC